MAPRNLIPSSGTQPIPAAAETKEQAFRRVGHAKTHKAGKKHGAQAHVPEGVSRCTRRSPVKYFSNVDAAMKVFAHQQIGHVSSIGNCSAPHEPLSVMLKVGSLKNHARCHFSTLLSN